MYKSLSTVAMLFMAASGFAQAQFTVTPVGVTSGSTMPGSLNDFIFFTPSDYNSVGSPGPHQSINNGTDYSQLSSFSISGGVSGVIDNNDATITTPAGVSLLTGDVQASPGIAFALEPGEGTNSDLGTEDTNLNPNFNYNNFYVYAMISNTNGRLTDVNVSLDQREFNGSVNPTFGTTSVPVVDNTTGQSAAQFVEFHVTGLGDAINAGYKPDLVLGANLAAGGAAYIGGVSFVSAAVPEPSTLLLGAAGLGALVVLARRKSASV